MIKTILTIIWIPGYKDIHTLWLFKGTEKDRMHGSGQASGGSGIPIYPLFCPQDTNIPQNRKMCDTKYLKLFWNRILNTWKWTSQILIKEKLLVHCPLPLPLRSASVHGDRILVTLSVNALCKRFFISLIEVGGVSGSVHQGQEQIILPLIYFNSFIVNNCNAAYNPLNSLFWDDMLFSRSSE